MTKELKYEVDRLGYGTDDNPFFYVLFGPSYDGTKQIMCDTLNCHHTFSLEDQELYMLKLAEVMNAADTD